MAAMVDIAKLHRAANTKKQIDVFLRSAAFRNTEKYLRGQGLTEPEIFERHRAYVNVPAVIKVHRLLAVEYIRWLDYDRYAKWVEQVT